MNFTKEVTVNLFDATVFTKFHFYYVRHRNFEAICSCKDVNENDNKVVFNVMCYLDGVTILNEVPMGVISTDIQRNTFCDPMTFYIDGYNCEDFFHIEEMECCVGYDWVTGTPIVRLGNYNYKYEESNCKKIKLAKENDNA